MFGITFLGHPDPRNLYLPGEFEGYPLRKDFPLLARVVKPWPGIVDVEPMPGEPAEDEAGPRGPRGARMTAVTERDQLRYIAQQAADARVNVELETEGMTLNMGPQHPATHGTLRIVAKLDGEQVIAAEPVAGYMHRGYEKLTEVRTYPQVTTLVNRIDWVGSFANEVPFILAAEELMDIEAPPRAQYIRTALFEMSRIANMVLFAGDMALQVGGATASFYAFRDREFVLNQIEAATGGRFHPNFDRIGGLKDDLPKGWIDDTKAAMHKVRDFCDEMDRLVTGNEIFETRTRGIGVIPGVGGPVLRPVGRQPPGLRRRLGPPPRRRVPGHGPRPARLEGHHPPRRRLLRPVLGCGSRRSARPATWSTSASTACRPDR